MGKYYGECISSVSGESYTKRKSGGLPFHLKKRRYNVKKQTVKKQAVKKSAKERWNELIDNA